MAAASRLALCALLLLAGCARREPGQIAAPTLSLAGFTVVSEQAVGPAEVESVLRAECVNDGPTVLGVSAVIESLEPGAGVVDGALRCGLVPEGRRAATLDTVTIRRPASSPFDPSTLRFLALTWGADTHVDDGGAPAGDVVAISHFVDLTNALGRDVGVVALASSTSPATVVLDGAISAPRVPDGRRLSTRDRFSVRHERAIPIDLDALDFALRLTPARTGDLDRDGDVDARDVQLAVACRHQDPAARCDCAAADMDGDGDIDAGDLDAVARARGPRDLPVAPPDPDAPVVSVTEPRDGAAIPASPVRVAGTLGEPAFRLTVDGIAAAVSPLQPYGWSADVPLAPGAVALEIVATDLACNTSRRTVPIVFGGGDALAPRVTLSAPGTVQGGASFRVVLDASDDGPLASLELQVDGAVVAAAASAPLVLDAVAPDLPGATLSLRGVARDAAGNAGEATGSVVLTDQPDTSPPVVTALLLPPSAAPGTRFRARAEVRDDRGVREVRFSLAGAAPQVDAAPPFEVELTVPPDAAPGSPLAVGAEAVDDADLTGSASGTVQIVADADVSSPFGVILQAPAEAVAGAGVVLSATASDDVGVALVRFFAGTQLVGEDALPPYEIGAALPPSAQPGASVTWRASALDFAGNAAHAAPVVTRVVAPRGGAVAGEVYDDATGRPLAGATVRVLSAGGAAPNVPVSATTDARGRYRFVLDEGPATLLVEHSGYTGARRSVAVPPGGIAAPLDARLAPVGASTPLTRRDGGALELGDGSAGVEVAPGALAGDATLGVQALGPQALPVPLPLGWSPLVALAVESAGVAFAAPVLVELRGAPAAEAAAGAAGGPILAAYDATSGEWRRAAPEPGAAPGSARVALAQPGAVAVVRADVAPSAPAVPAAGETLSGVSAAALPAGASADLLPSPRIVFAGADARADVALRIAAANPLPSGTRLAVAWSERYERIDGARLAPEPMEQDFLLYASTDGPRAAFVATPEPSLDPLSLREGAIDLAAAPPAPDRASGILSPAGGRLSTPGGVSLEILAGALSAPAVAMVETFDPATLALAVDARFVPVGGVTIDLGGAPLAAPGLLGLPLPAGVPAGDTLLLARVSSIGGKSELELVGLAQTAPGGLVVGAGGAGQPFPGVRGEGRYVLVHATVPLGFVTGSVLGGAASLPVVRAAGTPFVARAHDGPAGGAPRFALAAPLGDVTVEAVDPATGDSARISVLLATAGASVAQHVSLAPTPLRVAAIDPPDGAQGVAADAAVRVRFDRAVDPASVGAAAALRVGAADVPADVALAADGATLVLRPRAPLAGETLHAVRLAATLRDVFGRALAGGEADGSFASAFTTADTTPPARPAAGQVTIGIPANGTVRIAGTQGAAEPGVLVLARNDSTNATASVLAGADGSFAFDLPAGLPDRVGLVYRDAGGRETSFDPGPFTGPDGTVVIGSRGGVVTGAGGVQAIVPPGVVPDGTPIRVGAIAGAALATPIPSFMDFLTAFEIDMGAVKASDEIDISVPIPAGAAVDPSQDFYVFLERDVAGQGMYELVNVARAAGGRIETASPPFPGVRQSGRYFLGPPNLSLAIVAMTLAPSFSFSLAFGAAVPVLSAAANNLASSLDAMPIFAVPVDQPFTVTVFGQNAQPLLTLPFGAIPVAGITNLVVPPPDDGSPFEATTVLPADGSVEVFNRPTIRVVFNKELDEPSVHQHFQLADATATGSAAVVPGQITVENVSGAPRIVVFRPDARLKFGADYEIRMQGVCPFGQTQNGACQMPLTNATSTFKTFAPRALGTVAVGNPNDVSAWRPAAGLPVDRLLVANGTNADADSTGVAVIDVADPAAPVKLSERAIVGRTYAVLGIDDANLVAADGSKSLSGPVALSAGGGVNNISNLRVLAPTPDRSAVTSEGATLLSSSLAALQNGITLADIPPFVGSPNDLAFLPGDPNGAAYVATIGIGVQGVDLGLTLGTIRRQPGLFAFESVNSVETIGDHVMAGDRNHLVVLDSQLNLVATAPIGARALHAVAAYSGDFDGDGAIDPVSEVRDVVLAATDTPSRRITLVDVSQPAFPFALAVVELPSTPRDVFLDRVERMAYVATPAGVEIVDFSDPDAGNGGAVDVNGDGRDDRLLGRVAGIPTAGSIDVSDDGATGYVGAASGTTGEVYTALLSSGRFYVDFQDPQFPASKLRPADYYPGLGTRRFHVRGFEQDGTPGSGNVTATVVSAPAGVSVASAGYPMTNGLAEISFSAPGRLPSQGPIELELEWKDATDVVLRVRQKFTVRNNSITHLQEVLEGRAVFLAASGIGPDHAGVTPRPKEPIDAGYDPTPRPRSFAPLSERRWDFVEEMFNQTLLRKRSYALSVTPLFPFFEDGDYVAEDEIAVDAVKGEFLIPVNTTAANRSPTFRKLMKDYGIADATQTALHHRIVDSETLVMTTMRVQPDISQPCTNCDFAINTAAGNGDTGLYELYTNVVFRFVEDLIARAEQYRDGSAPANDDGRWVSRDGVSNPPALLDPQSQALWDGRNGVAYGYGSKLTVEEFNAKVSRFGAPDTVTIKALPPLGFRTYRGKLIDDATPGTVAPAGADPATTKMWSGIFSALEVKPHPSGCGAVGAPACIHPGGFASLDQPFYAPAYWAGIDCAGLVQRSALHARDRSPARLEPGFFTAGTNCTSGVPNLGVGLCDITIAANGWWLGTILGRDYWNRANVATNVWTNGGLPFAVHRGDQRVSSGHVSTLYSDPIKPTDDYYLIHAYGDNRYREGVKGNGTARFGRKVIVSAWRNHHGAWGVSRMKLWE